MNKLKGPKTF